MFGFTVVGMFGVGLCAFLLYVQSSSTMHVSLLVLVAMHHQQQWTTPIQQQYTGKHIIQQSPSETGSTVAATFIATCALLTGRWQ